jgi:hypothetical protein
MVAEVATFDLWTIFVQYVFGGFWLAVICIALLIFIIMGFMGRISIYSTSWYILLFFLSMTLGYGFVTLNTLITLSLLVAFFFSMQRYLDNK